jgi:hypothetical protein
MTSYASVTRQMVGKLTAFERGQYDYMSGLRVCPFKDALKAEQWRDGWLTERSHRHAA